MLDITYETESGMYSDILGIEEIDQSSPMIENVVVVQDLETGEFYIDQQAKYLLRGQKVHDLKTHPEYFKAVKSGVKLFELRKDDRGFKVNDILHLQEYDPITDKYTGRGILKQIAYILHGGVFGLNKGFVILSFSE